VKAAEPHKIRAVQDLADQLREAICDHTVGESLAALMVVVSEGVFLATNDLEAGLDLAAKINAALTNSLRRRHAEIDAVAEGTLQ
jgi:hypothetical protein